MQRGRRALFHAKVSLEEESGPEENGNSNYISFKGCPGWARGAPTVSWRPLTVLKPW